jgi:hypothetical protein
VKARTQHNMTSERTDTAAGVRPSYGAAISNVIITREGSGTPPVTHVTSPNDAAPYAHLAGWRTDRLKGGDNKVQGNALGISRPNTPAP